MNVIYIDWENDLVVVVRWIDSNRNLDQFLGKVIGAMTMQVARRQVAGRPSALARQISLPVRA